MSKRYEVKRFSSCYSLNWVDNKTNKELTAVEIEQIVNNQYQRIAELEAKLEEKDKNALALFSVLYDILEEQDPENVSSRIDYLTKQNNGAISDFYKEHKVLKQKLAESEKLKDDALYNYAWSNQEVSDIKQKLKDNEDAYKILCCNHQNLGKAYNELEQKLAEKNEEIEKLRTTNDRLYKKNTKLENKIVESNIRFYKKGSIEQLEKVKELAHNHIKEIANDLSEEDDERLNQKHTIHGLATAITDIDNQIKTLRGEK